MRIALYKVTVLPTVHKRVLHPAVTDFALNSRDGILRVKFEGRPYLGLCGSSRKFLRTY